MATPTYDVGDAVKAAVTFHNDAAPPVPTDPTNVTLTWRAPNGALTTYTIGMLDHPGAGVFAKTIVPATPGLHVLRWVGTGAVAQTVEQSYAVRPLSIDGALLGFYGDDPATSPIDELRLLLGDTNNDDVILSDNALAALLDVSGDAATGRPTSRTVVHGFLAMAAKYARLIDGSNGDVSRSYSQRAAAFRAMAEAVRVNAEADRVSAAQAAALTPPLPMAGGIDRPRDFYVGQWDTSGYYAGGWSDPRAEL